MKILVPFDASAPAERVLRFAIGLARAHKRSRIIVVNVQNVAIYGESEVMVGWVQKQANVAEPWAKILGKAMTKCRLARVKAVSRAEVGLIGPTINRLAVKLSVDQIVMGTRGLGGVRGLLLGSVATQVVHLAEVPVTLIK